MTSFLMESTSRKTSAKSANTLSRQSRPKILRLLRSRNALRLSSKRPIGSAKKLSGESRESFNLSLKKDKVVQELRYQASSEREEADRLRTEAELRATSAEAELEHLRTHERERTESRKRISRTTIGIIAAIAFAILCEGLIRRYSFPWLMDHPQSYGLRGAFYTGSAALLIGALRRDWLR